MRGLRSFLALLVILLSLGAYLYFVESKRPADSGDAKDKVFAVESDKISELTVKAESGDRTMLQKKDADWQLVQPLTAKADSSAVSGITSNLSSLEIQRVIDDNPPDLGEYGLATPRIELTFKADGEERQLQLGRKTPPGTDVYAKLGDQNRVFLISSFLESSFNKTTFDLRDKSALAVNRDAIDALTVNASGSTLRFTKSEGEWRIAEPVAVRTDFSPIEGLVSKLTTLQMKAITAENGGNPAEYGLDKPAATVTIGTGSSSASLAIGKASGENEVFARDLSRPLIFTIDDSLLDDLKKGPDEYRQKDLFDARAFNSTRVEVTRAGQTFTFEKSTTKNKDGQDEDVWKRTTPNAGDVDRSKLENLISSATQARATSFTPTTDKTGLDKPELTVSLTSNEGKRQETVTFARSGADVYAARTGEPGAVKLEATTLDNIVKALEELNK